MSRLVLLRHGQSEWNAANLFTGWWDADLTELGAAEAVRGGALLAERQVLPDVVHTSVQTRAIRTADLALHAAGRSWIPVRRHWRLNERHYGDLTGRNKAETLEKYGEAQVHVWRRSYDVPPPPIEADNAFNPVDDPRYADLPPEVRPSSECLADVVRRMLPYWHDAIVPDLVTGRVVLVAAHGNSLRALVKHLDGVSDDEIVGLNIPTGIPLVYELTDELLPIDHYYLGDPEAAKKAAEAVANQSKAKA
jgi:2,3-bisphosphoglycerate-dependent phosphoglycerate mutase